MKPLRISLILLLFGGLAVLGWSYFGTQKTELISPVLGISKFKFADNIWFPKKSELKAEQFKDAPDVTAVSAFFVNTQSGEVLYQKNPHDKVSIASLTKIMSAVIALELKSMDNTYEVSLRAAEMEPDKMLLIPSEKLTLKELLEGVFLVSANDAAEVVAEGTTGRREEFISLMNSKAKQLGMENSLFLNPTGLEENNGKQYSTAYDVSLMSRYLINKWPEIVSISSQPHIFIDKTANHQDYDLYSGVNLLTTYPGVIGLKTGYTPEAGLTLVTLARKGNKEVLGVLLGSTERRDDAKVLLDYSFKKLGVPVD